MKLTRPVVAVAISLTGTLAALAIGQAAAGARVAATPTVAGNGLIAFSSNRTGDQEIWTQQVDGNRQVDVSNSPSSSDSQAAWSPDGKKIAFVSDAAGSNDVWVMNADGTGKVNLTPGTPSSDTEPAWSPTGGKLVFTSDRSGDLEVSSLNPDGSSPTN